MSEQTWCRQGVVAEVGVEPESAATPAKQPNYLRRAAAIGAIGFAGAVSALSGAMFCKTVSEQIHTNPVYHTASINTVPLETFSENLDRVSFAFTIGGGMMAIASISGTSAVAASIIRPSRRS